LEKVSHIYDLIILGGGMSGISVGHFFRHRKILILERGNLLSGATGENAGFIVSGFGEHFSCTVSRLGEERANEIQQIHLSCHRRIRELAGSVDCGYQQTGSLAIALESQEEERLRRSHELMKRFGYDVDFVEEAQTGLKFPVRALLNRHDARFNSRKFWKALSSDLPIRTHIEVKSIRRHQEEILVETDSEIFRSARVVYCLNAFATALLPELEGRYIPLRGQTTELSCKESIPTLGPVFAEYGEIYWRFHDENLVFGGLEYLLPELETGIAEQHSAKLTELQIAWIRKHFQPGLFSESPRPVRTGFSTMAYTVDGFPFVGALPGRSNEFILSGLCGMGNSYALELGSWLYELIENDKNIVPRYFSSDRIGNLAIYSGGDWRKIYEAWNH
jgi:glycine/D-amino acid oxidase-like deaminating enzyme